MGLDTYIWKISKPEGLENRIYHENELLRLGLMYIKVDERSPQELKALEDCSIPLKTRINYICMDELREKYSLSPAARIGIYHHAGGITVVDTPAGEAAKTIDISKSELDPVLFPIDVDCRVFYREKVLGWRNSNRISGFFGDRIGPIDNCIYTPVPDEVITEANQEFDLNIPLNGKEKIFFFEWW